jgi:hypothetical protein
MTNEGNLSTSPRRQAILVLGMHRSGTSALGGVVNALGAAAPKTLMPPQADNPRGFFESAALADAHDALLASAGSSWHDWRQFDPRWLLSAAAEQHRHTVRALLVEEFGNEALIFVKDPRICRFLPFTLPVLAELNISPVAFLPVRNPLEVAYSLQRRNGFTLSKSLLLWLRHVLDAEFHSRQLPRYVLPYEKFLTDWRYYIDRAAATTGVVWPKRSDGADLAIEQFLAPELRHERASFDAIKDHPDVTPLVRETHNILASLADGGESQELLDQLDVIRVKFDEGCHMFGAAVAAEESVAQQLGGELSARNIQAEHFARENLNLAALSEQRSSEAHRLMVERDTIAAALNARIVEFERENSRLAGLWEQQSAEIRALTVERDSLAAARNNLVAERDAIWASHSWRLTAPLRVLAKLLGR